MHLQMIYSRKIRPDRCCMDLPHNQIVVYDGDCGVCSFLAAKIPLWAEADWEFRPRFTEDLTKFGICSLDCQNYLVLVCPAGVFYGADAVLRIFGQRLGFYWLSRILLAPPLIWLIKIFYRLFADNRRHISRLAGFNSCQLP